MYYSREEYLNNVAAEQRALIKGTAPPVQHPPQHEREWLNQTLASIPEGTPGPNAFAIREQKQAKLRDQLGRDSRYMNAWHERRITPTKDIHPAHRQRSNSAPPTPPRDSTCTNMTPFLEAGKEEPEKLKLGATPKIGTKPTLREMLEQGPQVDDTSEGSGDDIAVFHPTPKIQSSHDFAQQRPSTPANGLEKEEGGSKFPVKTPKKSLLSKFKFSTSSRTANQQHDDEDTQGSERLPVKASAVLGESPSKSKRISWGSSPTKIPRSPSKRSKLFSRKNSDIQEIPQRLQTSQSMNQRPQTTQSLNQRTSRTIGTTNTDVPLTAITDPSHWSYQDQRIVSKKETQDKPAHSRKESKGQRVVWSKEADELNERRRQVRQHSDMVRSSSLRYLDNKVPPTPLPKDTPPHEKAAKQAKEEKTTKDSMKEAINYQHELATEDGEQGIVSTSERHSPTKMGSYGYRQAPTLVTQPSMYSLHASFVPNQMDFTTVEEMNARVGGIDLEGHNLPSDTIKRSKISEAVYSPSIYSTDWGARTRRMSMGATPQTLHQASPHPSPSDHTKDSSSNGTIPIMYPDLAADPSIHPHQQKPHATASPNKRFSVDNVGTTAHLSPDHSALFTRSPNSNNRQRHSMLPNSPSTYSHASAMPSPLQFLPATTYTPSRSKGKGKEGFRDDADSKVNRAPAYLSPNTPSGKKTSGLGIQEGGVPDSPTLGSPTRMARGPDMVEKRQFLLATSSWSPVPKKIGLTSDRSLPGDDQAFASASKLPRTPPQAPQGVDGYSDGKLDGIMQRLSKLTPAELSGVRDLARAGKEDSEDSGDVMMLMIDKVIARRSQTSAITPSTDKFDVLLEMLTKITETRSSEMSEMREMREMFRASHNRMSEHLSQQHDVGNWVTEQNQAGNDASPQSPGRRVPTDVAHDFYRNAQQQGQVMQEDEMLETRAKNAVAAEAGAPDTQRKVTAIHHQDAQASAGHENGSSDGGSSGGAETIRALREENKKLMDIVGGFGEKIRMMEESMKRGSGSE